MLCLTGFRFRALVVIAVLSLTGKVAAQSISGCDEVLDVDALERAFEVEVSPEHREAIVVRCEGEEIEIRAENASTRLEAAGIPRVARERWVALSAARLAGMEAGPVPAEPAAVVVTAETETAVPAELEPADVLGEPEPVRGAVAETEAADEAGAPQHLEASSQAIEDSIEESPERHRPREVSETGGLQGEVHLGTAIALTGNPLSLTVSAGLLWGLQDAESLRFALGVRADFRYAQHTSDLGTVRAFPLGLHGVAELRGPDQPLSWVVDLAAGLRLLLVRTSASEAATGRDLNVAALALQARGGLQVRLSGRGVLSLLVGVEGEVSGFVATTDEGEALDLQGPRLTLQVGLRY